MKNAHLLFTLLFGALLLASCDEDNGGSSDPVVDGTIESKYIVTATPIASEGVADYILTADDLTTGTISTTANGIEQDGTYRYYVTSNNKLFSMLYGQGNAGAVTTYELSSTGELEKLSDFQSETVRAFAPVADDILTIKMTASADDPYQYWYRINTNSLTIVDEGQINSQEVADKENGELAYFSWITAKGDDLVYLPYFTIKGTAEGAWGTDYPDEANIAVYSYPEMEHIKTISDDRTSFIGRYFTVGLSFDEQGDGYAFSSAVPMYADYSLQETLPSAVTRISNETDDFDDYYFDLEEASDGYVIDSHIYAGDGKFIGIMQNKETMTTAWGGGNEYAIIDVYNKTFEWVTGMPDPATITNITSGYNNLVSQDGSTVHVGVTTETGSFVYNIDISAAAATQGLAVEGGVITAINYLEVPATEE